MNDPRLEAMGDTPGSDVCGCSRVLLRQTERPDLFMRDLRAIRRHAVEVVRQCDHYERNGPGDEIRFGMMYLEARASLYYARRADRRYAKAAGTRALA